MFAKNVSDENNSLYTYEINNQNLSSNLAILTACETSKPTHQSGEGMILLAMLLIMMAVKAYEPVYGKLTNNLLLKF
nr:hypothetical protein [uncultured Winogradskyella sp.]